MQDQLASSSNVSMFLLLNHFVSIIDPLAITNPPNTLINLLRSNPLIPTLGSNGLQNQHNYPRLKIYLLYPESTPT